MDINSNYLLHQFSAQRKTRPQWSGLVAGFDIQQIVEFGRGLLELSYLGLERNLFDLPENVGVVPTRARALGAQGRYRRASITALASLTVT